MSIASRGILIIDECLAAEVAKVKKINRPLLSLQPTLQCTDKERRYGPQDAGLNKKSDADRIAPAGWQGLAEKKAFKTGLDRSCPLH